ncbi:WhiB family transcriptional regulator [Saccharopolyspora indica]|uniref:WhiB family transcriptional regulator n=1 Tax=Saccharopolyspora indica TaxID=1229659 RepID=UPI0022EAC310|nr:WhiB family transcriptional regulator [Saccharopolyspora indica]MDA3649833.1 WhiB family transcriptional regulator [Saccharopolyspora indica]
MAEDDLCALWWRLFARRLWGAGTRPEWHEEAACADQPELFYSKSGKWAHNVEDARRVCNGCPVLAECLRDVIGWESARSVPSASIAGVAGGMTAEERKTLYARFKVKPSGRPPRSPPNQQ